MEILALYAFLAAVVASVLAIMALRRVAELRDVEHEVERLAREGRFLRRRLRELETGEVAVGEEPADGEPTDAAASLDVAAARPAAHEATDSEASAVGETVGSQDREPGAPPTYEVDGAAEREAELAGERARELAAALHHGGAGEGGDAADGADAEQGPDATDAPQPAPVAPAPRRAAAAKRSSIDLERLLGVRGAALAGGLVMALAAILFFKHAFERNWITPEMRIGGGVFWGLVLLGAGAFARKRALSWVPGALEGAGLVALYASIWASDTRYDFVSMPWSFMLMGLVTALGCFLALRHGSLITAQIGLLGGFATPLLLNTGRPQPFGLFGYLLLLDLALLFLGRRRSWPSVGVLAVLGTGLFQVLWFLAPDVVGRDQLGWSGGAHEAFGAVLLATFGLVFLAAGAMAAGRERRAPWRLVELGGLAASGALALYLAVESDLSGDLWPTALTALVLVAGATFVGAKRGDLVPATASVLLGLAMVAGWGLDRDLATAAEGWQLAGAALALAALVGLPRSAPSLAGPMVVTARTAAVGAALVLLLLAVGGTSVDARLATVAPLLVGLFGASALLLGATWGDPGEPGVSVERAAEDGTFDIPDGRATLATLAGALPGAGLLARALSAQGADDPLGLGAWSVLGVLAVALGLALAAAARADRGAMRLHVVLGAGLGALAMLLDVELLAQLQDGADQAAFRALVGRGLAVPTLIAALALGAAATVAHLRRTEPLEPAAKPALRPWLDGSVLVLLVPLAFLFQLWSWSSGVSHIGYRLPSGQASSTWGLAAGDGAQALGLAWAMLVAWLLLLWPAVHARHWVGDRAGLGSWSWRLLALLVIPTTVPLERPFRGATGLEWELAGALTVAGALAILLLVAWRLVEREDEPLPTGQRTALTWVGFMASVFAAFAVADQVGELEALTFFAVLAMLQGGLAFLARRSAASWMATIMLLFAILGLVGSLIDGYGPEFGTPLLGWHTYGTLGLALAAGVVALLSERTRDTGVLPNLPQGGTSPPSKRTDGVADGDAPASRSFLVRRTVLFASVLLLVFLWINLEISNHFDGAQRALGNSHLRGPNLVIGGLPPRDLAMSLAWGLFALGLLFLGSRRASGAIRWTSLAMMMAAITKVFLSDLAHLKGLYRVASLAGLALALLLVSVLYQRFVFQRPPGDHED